MADALSRFRRFLRELKRRSVYKVAVAYLAVAFVGIQAARMLVPPTTLPAWADDLLIYLAVFGFPVALVLAWAFEMTPDGVRRTPEEVEVEGREAPSRTPSEPLRIQEEREDATGRSPFGVKALVALGLLAGAVVGGWYLTAASGEGREIDDRSVAVLPFATLGDSSEATFTQGLHTSLLTALQQISGLTVKARPSVMQYRNYEESGRSLVQVAEALGARWIVTATVQSVGDQVQVQPQLTDPRTGAVRWSGTYTRELSAERMFALQEEITRHVAEALETELAPAESDRIRQRPTGDLDAYQVYAQGREELARRTFGMKPEDALHVRRAVRYFRRAIERDSSFAPAWAGLADAAGHYPAQVPDTAVVPKVGGEEAARRALELDPNLAEAHASLGYVHIQEQDAPAAVRRLQRALELKPSYWEAHNWLGGLYLRIGRLERAMDHLSIAVELNPQHARARHYLYDAYLASGQAQRSLREARRQQRLGLEETSAVGGQVRALYALERYEEASRLAHEQIAGLGAGAPWREIFRSYLVIIRAARGDTAGARDQLRRMRAEDLDPEAASWVEPAALGWAHAALGETDRALEALGRLGPEAWGSLGLSVSLRYGVHIDLDPLRDDRRFQELMREANRAWGLAPDGSLPEKTPG